MSDVRNGTDRLMQTALKFLTLEECALYYFPLAFDETWNTQICAGNPLSFNSAVCLGDSGGPNLVPSPNGRPANDTIIGITSFAGGKCTGAPGAQGGAGGRRRLAAQCAAKLGLRPLPCGAAAAAAAACGAPPCSLAIPQPG